jgi:hypothetical protein
VELTPGSGANRGGGDLFPPAARTTAARTPAMGGEATEGGDAAGVTALTVDSAVLNIFWELAAVQKAKREVRSRRCARTRTRNAGPCT